MESHTPTKGPSMLSPRSRTTPRRNDGTFARTPKNERKQALAAALQNVRQDLAKAKKVLPELDEVSISEASLLSARWQKMHPEDEQEPRNLLKSAKIQLMNAPIPQDFSTKLQLAVDDDDDDDDADDDDEIVSGGISSDPAAAASVVPVGQTTSATDGASSAKLQGLSLVLETLKKVKDKMSEYAAEISHDGDVKTIEHGADEEAEVVCVVAGALAEYHAKDDTADASLVGALLVKLLFPKDKVFVVMSADKCHYLLRSNPRAYQIPWGILPGTQACVQQSPPPSWAKHGGYHWKGTTILAPTRAAPAAAQGIRTSSPQMSSHVQPQFRPLVHTYLPKSATSAGPQHILQLPSTSQQVRQQQPQQQQQQWRQQQHPYQKHHELFLELKARLQSYVGQLPPLPESTLGWVPWSTSVVSQVNRIMPHDWLDGLSREWLETKRTEGVAEGIDLLVKLWQLEPDSRQEGQAKRQLQERIMELVKVKAKLLTLRTDGNRTRSCKVIMYSLGTPGTSNLAYALGGVHVGLRLDDILEVTYGKLGCFVDVYPNGMVVQLPGVKILGQELESFEAGDANVHEVLEIARTLGNTQFKQGEYAFLTRNCIQAVQALTAGCKLKMPSFIALDVAAACIHGCTGLRSQIGQRIDQAIEDAKAAIDALTSEALSDNSFDEDDADILSDDDDDEGDDDADMISDLLAKLNMKEQTDGFDIMFAGRRQ